MPDISMCKNDNCPLKEKCYRYTAEPSPYRQSYGLFPQPKDGKCEYFWDNEWYEKLKQQRDEKTT